MIWVHFGVFEPFWSNIIEWKRIFFRNLATRIHSVANPFGILVDANCHCNHKVKSMFGWSSSVLGQIHVLPCKIIHQCLRGVYEDILGCLEFLFQMTTHSIRNTYISWTATANNLASSKKLRYWIPLNMVLLSPLPIEAAILHRCVSLLDLRNIFT